MIWDAAFRSWLAILRRSGQLERRCFGYLRAVPSSVSCLASGLSRLKSVGSSRPSWGRAAAVLGCGPSWPTCRGHLPMSGDSGHDTTKD
jgi:hypothetical protein